MKKNILFLLLPSIIISVFIAEAIVRITWDKKQGTPGLVLLHPTRIETLAPNYRGYFSGQPLRVNNLGFRDDQDYKLGKSGNTFRIIVLGDSVTFGDGCKFNETWPYLLKKRLEEWDSSINWEVWNLSVPGYDSVLELRTLEELGPVYKPDLVIVGFYENDLMAWDYHSKKTQPKIIFQIKSFLKRHFYLYTKLRYIYNVLTNLKCGTKTQCEWEQGFLKKPDKEIPAKDISKFVFKHNRTDINVQPISYVKYEYTGEGLKSMKKAIDKFKEYNSSGTYHIVFFINIAPEPDLINDRFVDGIHGGMNKFFLELLGGSTPVVSGYDAFRFYRPSEVPDAGGHSLAAANMVKADVLFNFLKENVLRR